jgi:hypothetical protein
MSFYGSIGGTQHRHIEILPLSEVLCKGRRWL